MTTTICTDIIALLARQEETIAHLYSEFAKHLPEMKRFWDNLVVQEKAHADVLNQLAKLCESGKCSIKTSKFNRAAVETNILSMNRMIEKTASDGVTAIQALALSSDIEHSLIESEFFRVIEPSLASVRKELQEIEDHTQNHIKMVDKQLNELRNESSPASGDHNVSVKGKIIEAQREIIDQLSKCEDSISRLYSIYSRKFPDTSAFWSDLSKKEEAHAKLLKTMHRQLDKGDIFRNIGRFTAGTINAFLDKLNTAINKAEQNEIVQKEAIQTALSIESSVLDAHFYDIVKSDSREFTIIAERLSADTHDHVKAVQRILQNA